MKFNKQSFATLALIVMGAVAFNFLSFNTSYANTEELRSCSDYVAKGQGYIWGVPSSEKIANTDVPTSYKVVFIAKDKEKLNADQCQINGATFAAYTKSKPDFKTAVQTYLGSVPLKLDDNKVPVVSVKDKESNSKWTNATFEQGNISKVQELVNKLNQCGYGQKDVYLSNAIYSGDKSPGYHKGKELIHLPLLVFSNATKAAQTTCSPVTPPVTPGDSGGGQGNPESLKSIKTGSDLMNSRNIVIASAATLLGVAFIYFSYKLRKR